MAYIPSETTLFSTYSSFAGPIMLFKTIFDQLIPYRLRAFVTSYDVQEKIMSKLRKFFPFKALLSQHITLTIDQQCDFYTANEVFEAAEIYLASKISPSNKRLKVSKATRDKAISITIKEGEVIVDRFKGSELRWVMAVCVPQKEETTGDTKERKTMELSFGEEHKEMVLKVYLPFVLESAKKIQEQNRVVKLHSVAGGGFHEQDGSINLQHPSTFDTLAMEPGVKKALIDDLDRFVKRRDYYRRVGKVWKRGYLLHGPPGTGKSSLVAAMANYLKFHIYDFELSALRHVNFRRLLVSTANRSIIVIEDIDCSTKLQNRVNDLGFDDAYPPLLGFRTPQVANHNMTNNEESLPLAGLLNFIDGLWSSCGDERIIVFTINDKEKLDPALLRPGRMDMHIHMSYLTFGGFKVLALNYLDIDDHPSFPRIEALLREVQVTPAIVAEELMKGDDVDEVLKGLSSLLLHMKEEGETETSEKIMDEKLSMETRMSNYAVHPFLEFTDSEERT